MGYFSRIERSVWSSAAILASVWLGVGCAAEGAAPSGRQQVVIGPGTTGATGAQPTGSVPCAVETVVKANCQLCHGAQPIGGAPMSLVTLADFQKDITVAFTDGYKGQVMKAYAVSQIRIQPTQGAKRMPQGRTLTDPDFNTLNTWFQQGAPAGAACGATGAAGGGSTVVGAAGSGAVDMSGGSLAAGTGSVMAGTGAVTGGAGGSTSAGGTRGECDAANAFEPLVARDGETCYEFLTHDLPDPNDTTPFQVLPGESYNQLYYAIPWPAGTVATRFGAKFDNLAVLHHWLGFATAVVDPGGVSKNVLGTTLGESAELVGGWAVGGCNTEFASDVGLKLPDTGGIMIQWHHYNQGATTAEDSSIVQWCGVPQNARPNIASLTFLGTESLAMGPGMQTKSGTCANDSGGDITIVGFEPHMHLLGVHMTSVVHRASGDETVFDKPFQFDAQYNYRVEPRVVLKPGETIESTCTFNNTTSGNVDFGQSTTQEMCYQFAYSYPYGAFNNGVLSLIGATNVCW